MGIFGPLRELVLRRLHIHVSHVHSHYTQQIKFCRDRISGKSSLGQEKLH